MSLARGFVYGATGEVYARLAARSAESLRAVSPGIPIDIWTDIALADPVFDQVHQVDSFHRPKFQALRESRFERTVYIDADTVAIADISDLFDVLDRFDVLAAHIYGRNDQSLWRKPVPASFPQVNGGMIGIRRSEATRDLLARVEAALREEKLAKDQPVLRELLWDSDLRLAIVPPEYNFKQIPLAYILGSGFSAPRLLHSSRLRKRAAGGEPRWLDELYDDALFAHIRRLLAADRQLNPDGPRPEVEPLVALPHERRRRWRDRLGLPRTRPGWPFSPPADDA